jgi:hypothetical protein
MKGAVNLFTASFSEMGAASLGQLKMWARHSRSALFEVRDNIPTTESDSQSLFPD